MMNETICSKNELSTEKKNEILKDLLELNCVSICSRHNVGSMNAVENFVKDITNVLADVVGVSNKRINKGGSRCNEERGFEALIVIGALADAGHPLTEYERKLLYWGYLGTESMSLTLSGNERASIIAKVKGFLVDSGIFEMGDYEIALLKELREYDTTEAEYDGDCAVGAGLQCCGCGGCSES